MDKKKLFEEFPPVSRNEWLGKIETDLKGADFNKKMVWRTGEGFDLQPFYRREDTEGAKYIESLPGVFPYIRGYKTDGNSWLIRQNIHVSDYAGANRRALDILMKGVDSLGFVIEDPESINAENFNILLKGIHAESIETNFLSNGKALEILDILAGIVSARGLDPAKIHGAIEADPLGRLMLNGTLCIPESDGFDYLARLTAASSVLPGIKTIHLKASSFVNAGTGVVQELGFALSMGSEYLSQLTSRNIDGSFAASKIRFSFGTGSDYFMEIAKLRAARLLWSAILKGFIPGNTSELRMNIHCVTGEWNKTIFDPHVNMLRTQTEAMSAILGGTDSLTVEPYDITFRQPDEFSERIARNQQLLLREEAYFDKVNDPAAGSYYIEHLTRMIADGAWKLFVDIEEKGGFLEALHAGLIQSLISRSAETRKKEAATRKRTFVGINQYPNPYEKASGDTDYERAFGKKPEGSDLVVEPITLFRGAEEFEKIRISVSQANRQPVVFLFTIGNPAMRRARAQFSAGFFGCAGYRIIDNRGFSSVSEGIDAFIESQAEIVVICSSDEEYMQYAPEIFDSLHEKAAVVIAGNPASSEELKALGIDLFIHLRSDVPEMLRLFNKKLGINN